MKELIALEIALHKKQPHTGETPLSAMLHNDFFEIGRSGARVGYQDAAGWLDSDAPSGSEIWSQDFDCSVVAEGLVLLIYNSAELGADGSLQKHARRSSLWQKVGDQWQLRFHQATAVTGF
ncbi:DUF4440 domain-containing protein [Reinekea marinisedimentorum]|uniref:DUF4440 domain-containing protein n=1 Tax=Reinekea marinisedimentorum TaxID=230495 RepID=A0A4R3IBN1_9GAMM|nr:DUF4440 domain-containing protein [Reinekea marinisedimentorum]TCS42691.1 hypothetical protein BCF53_103361 [Reinekea marinisedimentorum]